MKRTGSRAEAFAPWAGLAIGVLAVGTVHQLGADGTFDKCSAIAPWPLLAVASLGLIACAVSGSISWRSLSASDDLSRRVVAVISIGCAALFSLAILFPMVAAMVLPPCFG